MTKAEHRAESWAYAKALDRLALPRIYELGQGAAYRWAGEQLRQKERSNGDVHIWASGRASNRDSGLGVLDRQANREGTKQIGLKSDF